jgi:hypothetical protein
MRSGRLLLVSVAGFFGGVMMLAASRNFADQAREFPRPVDITVDQLIAQHPAYGWFRVTDGVLPAAYTVESYETNYGIRSGPVRDYMPMVHASDLSPDGLAVRGAPISLIVRVADANADAPLRACDRIEASGRGVEAGEARSDELTTAERQSLLIDGPIVGTIGHPSFEESKADGLLGHMRSFGRVSDQPLILEEGGSLRGTSIQSALFGLLLIVSCPVLLVTRVLRWRAGASASAPAMSMYGAASAAEIARRYGKVAAQQQRDAATAQETPRVMPGSDSTDESGR